VINYTLSFGKYKGKFLSEVPSDYIGWLARQHWLDPDLHHVVEEVLKARTRTAAQHGNRRERYKIYLGSEGWATLAAAVRTRCGGICERCKVHKMMDVHHRTYRRLGHEFPSDLIGLCRSCHRFMHGRGPDPMKAVAAPPPPPPPPPPVPKAPAPKWPSGHRPWDSSMERRDIWS